MIVLAAAAFLALGLVNFDLSAGWWRGQSIRLAIGLPIVLAYAYVAMPPLVFPQAITLLLLTLVPNAVFSGAIAARTHLAARRIVSIRRVSVMPYLAAIALVGGYALFLAAAPIVDASGLRDVAGATVVHSVPPSSDLRHVRVVPEESAIFAGEKSIGQLGAYYRVGTYNVQVERGSLVWVAPLEYQGLIQWLVRRTSPGVMVVSAENPDAGADLRRREPMRYIPSALLNENLRRHVYFRYGTELILEQTLQLDDHGDPQYVVTLGRPTVGWSGERVTAVVLVDPASGAMRRVPRREFSTLPAWVSRVYPPDLALAYNEWFGRYVHGWWNAQLARRDVHVPARDEVFGMLAAPGSFVWFVDHTSPSTTDQSMTGFTFMDARTGALTYYTSSGGEFSSLGAENAVASNPLVRQGRLLPTQPILYRVDDANAWVVPLVADTGKYQSLALVDARSGRVVVGNPSSASPEADAFAQFAVLHGGARAVAGASRTGTLDRVAIAGGTVYFTLAGSRVVYAAAGAGGAALLARSGDRVTFDAPANASGGAVAAAAFRDLTLER